VCRTPIKMSSDSLLERVREAITKLKQLDNKREQFLSDNDHITSKIDSFDWEAIRLIKNPTVKVIMRNGSNVEFDNSTYLEGGSHPLPGYTLEKAVDDFIESEEDGFRSRPEISEYYDALRKLDASIDEQEEVIDRLSYQLDISTKRSSNGKDDQPIHFTKKQKAVLLKYINEKSVHGSEELLFNSMSIYEVTNALYNGYIVAKNKADFDAFIKMVNEKQLQEGLFYFDEDEAFYYVQRESDNQYLLVPQMWTLDTLYTLEKL